MPRQNYAPKAGRPGKKQNTRHHHALKTGGRAKSNPRQNYALKTGGRQSAGGEPFRRGADPRIYE